jgi:hypothetical protein
MRKTTKRKFWGRSAIVQELRDAVNELNSALIEGDKPSADSPLTIHLRKVQKAIDSAIEYEKIYALQRKRIKTLLENEKTRIAELLALVTGTAVLPHEKALQKQKAAIRKTGGK